MPRTLATDNYPPFHRLHPLLGYLSLSESLVRDIQRIIVERYDKEWSPTGDENRLGKRPLEGAASLIEQFDLPLTPQQLIEQSQELIRDRWEGGGHTPEIQSLLKCLT